MGKYVDARYELFGWDYAAVNPLSEAEVAWHVRWAKTTGGPVLGLACGTARLLCRLAEAGFQTVGLDRSDTMLALARQNAARLPIKARDRVHLVKGDMARFDLRRRFGLVTIADNSFRELPTRRQLRQCLATVRRHLRPDGRLLIVERRFRPEMYPNGVRRFGWSEPRRNPDTGESVRRRGTIHLHKNQRRLSGVFEYEVTGARGDRRIVRCPWSAPVLSFEEYLSLFHRAGFQAEVFSDYGSVPGNRDGDLWCFVCLRR